MLPSWRAIALAIAAVICSQSGIAEAGHSASGDVPEWTLMLFMNADNNLEHGVIEDYKEVVQSLPSRRVRILAQMDRPRFGAGPWTRAHRFDITPVGETGGSAEPNNWLPATDESWPSVTEIAEDKCHGRMVTSGKEPGYEADMGCPAEVADFVTWSLAKSPRSAHYALILLGHGDGTSRGGEDEHDFSDTNMRSIGRDDDRGDTKHGQPLFVRGLARALKRVPGLKLDVIGFDACLMATLEVAYSMRDVANVMIASEEAEEQDGWAYKAWLTDLSATLQNRTAHVEARDLAKRIVASYRSQRSGRGGTLSAMDLSKIASVTDKVDALSVHLLSRLKMAEQENSGENVIEELRKARLAVSEFGVGTAPNQPHFSVDLVTFLEAIHLSDEPETQTLAAGAIDALVGKHNSNALVFESYASPRLRRNQKMNPRGVAIYFPRSSNYLLASPGQQEAHTRLPSDKRQVAEDAIDFVQDFQWADVANAYVAKVADL